PRPIPAGARLLAAAHEVHEPQRGGLFGDYLFPAVLADAGAGLLRPPRPRLHPGPQLPLPQARLSVLALRGSPIPKVRGLRKVRMRQTWAGTRSGEKVQTAPRPREIMRGRTRLAEVQRVAATTRGRVAWTEDSGRGGSPGWPASPDWRSGCY